MVVIESGIYVISLVFVVVMGIGEKLKIIDVWIIGGKEKY